jgi:hypothetical protein
MCNFFLNSAKEKVTVPFASGIHRRTQTVDIALGVMFHEQCQGEGEQFPSPPKYTNEHKSSVLPSV